MTVQLNLRNMSGAVTTHPNTGRTIDEPVASRWTRPAVIAILAVAVLVGALALRLSSPTDKADTTPRVAVSAGHEPLIIAEEQAFIDRLHSPVVQVASMAPVAATNVQPLIIPEEQAFIDGKYAGGTVVDGVDWCATQRPC